MTHLKTLFWTTLFWIVAIAGLYGYIVLIDKPLGSKIASYISSTTSSDIGAECIPTQDTIGDNTSLDSQAVMTQLQSMQTQLMMMQSMLESIQSMPVANTEISSNTSPSINTARTQTVQLYYFNQLEDQKLPVNQQLNTNSILPVQRTITVREDKITDTINTLIQTTLSQEEMAQGFTSEFPHNGFRLLSARLASDGTLTLEFTIVPGFTSGGSARVLLLRSAIEKTALQFSEVKRVEFMPIELFQP